MSQELQDLQSNMFNYIQTIVKQSQNDLKRKHARRAGLTAETLTNTLQNEMYDTLQNHSNVSSEQLKQHLEDTAHVYLNRPMAMFIANGFHEHHPAINYDELKQQAVIALYDAIHQYDPTRRTKKGTRIQFSTFAYTVISNKLKHVYHRHNKIIQLPNQVETVRGIAGRIIHIWQIDDKLRQKIKDVDHVYTIVIQSKNGYVQYFNFVYNLKVHQGEQVKRGQVLGQRSNTGMPIDSLDKTIAYTDDGEEKTLLDTDLVHTNDMNAEYESELQNAVHVIKGYVSKMDPLDQHILKLRFPILAGNPNAASLTQKQIGERLNLTQPIVSKHQRDCIKELKEALQYQGIDAKMLVN